MHMYIHVHVGMSACAFMQCMYAPEKPVTRPGRRCRLQYVTEDQRWLFSPLLLRTVRFAGVDEKPTRSVRHTAQSSAPPPPPCASHPQLAAHDALMRPFQALTDSCDEQPFNSLSEHPPPAHSHATRTLHSAPHAHTPPRTRGLGGGGRRGAKPGRRTRGTDCTRGVHTDLFPVLLKRRKGDAGV